MEKLRPNNNNGDAIALGSVTLAVAVLVTFARMHGPWAAGVNLAYTALAAALVLGLAYLSPTRKGRPTGYQTVLFVSGFLIAALAVFNVADVLGAGGLSAGTRVWTILVLLVIAAYVSWFRNSGVMTLFAALLKIGLILSFVEWVFTPNRPLETDRYLLVFIVLIFVAVALFELVPQKYRQVAIVDAAGFALLGLSLTFIAFGGGLDVGGHATSAGWEIAIAIGSLLLIAYAMLDGDPGPAYLGGFNLVAFGLIAATTDDAPSFIWWPLILLLLAGGLFAAAFTGVKIPKLSEARSLIK
jgi:hypothetical protein